MSSPAPAATYPELPPDLRGGLRWSSLKYFGAGAIIASVTIGSGETFFASKGGAVFGYTLMWCFVLSALLKGLQVYSSARVMTLTGRHPMEMLGQLSGGVVPWFFAILSIACFPFWLSGLPLMIGTALNWVVGIPFDHEHFELYAKFWGTGVLVVCGTLALVQTYKLLETIQMVLVGLLLLSMAVAFVVTRPDLLALFKGLVPSDPGGYPDWYQASAAAEGKALEPLYVFIGTCLGAVGGGIYDYIGYLGCFREKKWGLIGSDTGGAIAETDENVGRGRHWLLPAKIDVGAGFLCVLLFTVIFVSLGAEILHPQEMAPGGNDMLSQQASFLTQIHGSLKYLYQVGIFMAFFGTIYGAFEIYIRTAYESLRPIVRPVRTMKFSAFRIVIVAYCVLVPIVFIWTIGDANKLITPAAIIGGVLGCGLWCLAMIWVDRRFLPGRLRMGAGLTSLVAVAGIVLTVLGVVGMLHTDWVGYWEQIMSIASPKG